MAKKDGDASIMVILVWLFGPIWAIGCAGTVLNNRYRSKRHRLALPNRSPWSLQIGPGGITTTDNFRRTISWDRVETVTSEMIEADELYTYPGLHVDFVDDDTVTSLRPAGWFYPGDVPSGTEDRVPVCVLGPLTEHQHFELTEALTRHAGTRWRPKLGHTDGDPTATA